MTKKTKKLEKEFAQRLLLHKAGIICAFLVKFEDKGVYEDALFKPYSYIDSNGEEKAQKVVMALFENKELFEIAYEYSWKTIRYLLG